MFKKFKAVHWLVLIALAIVIVVLICRFSNYGRNIPYVARFIPASTGTTLVNVAGGPPTTPIPASRSSGVKGASIPIANTPFPSAGANAPHY